MLKVGDETPLQYGSKTRHPLYWTWRNIILRCKSDHPAHFGKYKGRGIRVCQRWSVFENFIADMGDRPDGASIDRIDNDLGYSPENCRWASKKTQSRNRRYVRRLTLNGETKILSDWAKELGVNPSTISMRIDAYGWSVEKALQLQFMR